MKTMLLILTGLLIAVMAQAQIIHVPADYPTIQQGINAATNGDTVLVSDGTYYEQINFLGKKPLMVASQFIIDGDTNHIANTIIDGIELNNPDSASVVYFVNHEDTTSILCGFTVQNGRGTYTTDNNNDRQGGGIWISNSGAKIIHNRITHNTLDDTQPGNGQSTSGGGIGAKFGYGNYWIVIEHNTIDSNSCISQYEYATGGGIALSYNSRIAHNNILHNSGRVYQTAQMWGGGIYISGWPNTVAIIEENAITHNVTEGLVNTCSAGVECDNVKVIFSKNLIAENTIKPGGLGGGAGFLLYQPSAGSVVSGNTFRENISNIWIGGGMVVQTNSTTNTVLVENNYFINNWAPSGGAFCMLNNPVLFQNNVFIGNHAANSGGALYLLNNLNLQFEHLATLINNSFYNNTASSLGGSIYSQLAKPLIFNSIFWNDSANNGQEIYLYLSGDTLEIANSNIDFNHVNGNLYDGGGNIDEDPLFDDLELLTISESSPCVNSGIEEYYCHCGDLNECPHYDITGTYRPHGGFVDMGAYEVDFGTGTKESLTQKISAWHSVYPNPFTDQTKIRYELDRKTKVVINLYNSSGELFQTLLSEQKEAGNHELRFSSGIFPAGIYFYRISTDSKQATGRMILMK